MLSHVSAPPKAVLPGLDLIRLAAAVMVMIFHLGYYSWAEPHSSTAEIASGAVAFPTMAAFSSWGWVGVEVFFVLSGFVIAYSAHGSTPWQFFRSRMLRLAPGVWVCAWVSFAILVALGMPAANKMVRTILFSPAGPWVDGAYWTLGVEIGFYACVLLVLLTKNFHRITWLAWALAACSTYELAFRPIPLSRIEQLLQLEYGCFFAMGIFLWHWLVQKGGWRSCLGVIVCLPGCYMEIWAGTVPRALTPGVPMWAPAVVWSISVLLIILSTRWGGSSNAIRLLGLATYPLYLLHDVLGAYIMRLSAAAIGGLSALIFAILASLVLALFVAKWPEPALRKRVATLADTCARRATARRRDSRARPVIARTELLSQQESTNEGLSLRSRPREATADSL